jgi:carbon-monoxide dehydrogenase large subunit
VTADATSGLGASVRRREDGRFLTGTGRFLDDLRVPGLLHLGLVRSTHAHARIRSINTEAAARLPGVAAVLTATDLPELGAGVPALVPAPAMRPYRQPVLARDRVRHVGEAVAVVVASTSYQVADALDSITVDYEPLPCAADVDAAQQAGAPRVHEDWLDNHAGRAIGAVGNAAEALRGAALVVEASLTYPRIAGVPIEPRGVVAYIDAIGVLTVWSSTQVPYQVRGAIAAALVLPEALVRALAPDVGGGFGVKGHVYPEDIVVPAVARRLGRPIKWVESRREHFLTAAADRDQRHRARLGVCRDGTIVGLETRFTKDHGAYPTLGDAIVLNTINHLPGPYRVPHFQATADSLVTHKTFAAAYRGAGRPEAAFVVERLLDRAARRLGMDPAELRRRNMIRPDEMPYRSGLTYRDGVHVCYDAADYPRMFEQALTLLDYTGWRQRQGERRDPQRPIGVGLATYVEGTGLGPFEGAEIHVDPSGTVLVHVGVASQGQGHETTLAQICAHELGVPLERVVVLGGDTTRPSHGMGTIGSRVAAVAGPAVFRTAREVARKARLVAAERLECAPTDVVLAEGRAVVRGAPSRGIELAEIARVAVRSPVLALESGPGLQACVFFYPETVTWAFGAHACVVEVDLDSCELRLLRYVAVHDCGQPINLAVVEGQVHGGVVQGLGAAFLEELVYDAHGQLLTGTLMDYGLPRADMLPRLTVGHLDAPSAQNELGIKGVGESGCIAPTAAVANAVEDALAHLDAPVVSLPLTGQRLFALLHSPAASAPASGRPG